MPSLTAGAWGMTVAIVLPDVGSHWNYDAGNRLSTRRRAQKGYRARRGRRNVVVSVVGRGGHADDVDRTANWDNVSAAERHRSRGAVTAGAGRRKINFHCRDRARDKDLPPVVQSPIIAIDRNARRRGDGSAGAIATGTIPANAIARTGWNGTKPNVIHKVSFAIIQVYRRRSGG